MGICLSDLVSVPAPSGTNSATPLPSISGINQPVPSASAKSTTTTRPLAWWEILLMALGCAFIFIVILMLWRRHARKRRAKATALFASAKRLDRPLGWRGRLVRFGERLFGHRRTHLARAQPHAPYAYAISKPMPMDELRVAEEAQHERDVDKLLDAYDYSRAGSSRGPSPLPSLHDYGHAPDTKRPLDAPHRLSAFSLSNESLYSHVTGQPRTGPQARQPVRAVRDLLPSRFSFSTASASPQRSPEAIPPPLPGMGGERPMTPAQEYARLVSLQSSQPQPQSRGTYWVERTDTGNSRNPFRQ